MPTSRTGLALIGLSLCVMTLSSAPGVATAAGRAGLGGSLVPQISGNTIKELEVAPTGDGASEAECKRYEVAINSWRDEVLERNLRGDNKGAYKAHTNQKALQEEAKNAGCFIIY